MSGIPGDVGGFSFGASGAIAAQIISSFFVARHDTKRFEWEKATQERD